MMLTKIREASSGWVGRSILVVLVGFLILSFGIWGISDVFRGFGQDKLAHVGKTDISAERFRQEIERERRSISTRTGKGITNDQLVSFGVPQRVMQRLMTEATLDENARAMLLGVSDEGLLRQIVEDPNLRGPSGSFDKAYFQRLLRENGYTEAAYVAQRRTLARRTQIADFVNAGMTPPALYDTLVHRYQTERRTTEYAVLAADRFAKIAAPSDEVIEKYFQITKSAFAAPEFRKAVVLNLTPQALAAGIAVSDEDIKDAYERQQDRLGSPERRALKQLTFKDKAEADAALAKLAAGTAFDALVTELGKKPEDVDLGVLTRAQMIDTAIADAAFALPAKGNSAVLERPLGHVIVHVAAITPAVTRTLDQVKDQLKGQITLERARRKLLDLHDKIEDDRSAGLKLQEIAAKYQLGVLEIAAINRQGQDAAGNAVNGLEGRDQVLEGLFTATANAFDADPLQLTGGNGFVWYDVLEVTKAHERALADVKPAVIARWTAEQERRALSDKAVAIIAALKEGKSLKDIAKAEGIETRMTAAFTRADPVVDFSRNGIDEVFRTAKGAAGTAPAENGRDRVVFVVLNAEVPTFAPLADAVKRELQQSYDDGLLSAYVERLETIYGAKVNQSVMNRAVGQTNN